jgi:hypothetical protein
MLFIVTSNLGYTGSDAEFGDELKRIKDGIDSGFYGLASGWVIGRA